MGKQNRVTRRRLLRYGGAAGALALAGCTSTQADQPLTETKSTAEKATVVSSETPTEATTAAPMNRSTEQPAEGSATETPTGTATADEWEQPPDLCHSDPSLSSPGPLKAEFKSREKYKCAGRPFDNFESLEAWTADVGVLSATNRKEYRFRGSRAAELRVRSGGDRVRISRRFANGVDLSSRDLSLGAKLLSPSQETVIVQALAPDPENKLVFVHPMHSRWGWVRLDLGPANVVGSPDLTDVRELRISLYTDADEGARLAVDSMRTTPKADTGRVILTFDDNSTSHYETAFPILEQYGYSAVVGANPWDVGEQPDDLTVEQLAELDAAGWDITSYPKQPQRLSSYPSLKQIEILRESKQWLIDQGFEDGARFLVWPSTKFSNRTHRFASRYHYLGFTGAPSLSGSLLTSPTKITRTAANKASLSEIDELIDLADEYNQLLVLTAHGIGEDETMVGEKKFESIVESISESGLTVSTASDLWDSIE